VLGTNIFLLRLVNLHDRQPLKYELFAKEAERSRLLMNDLIFEDIREYNLGGVHKKERRVE
jgi:hypothetical protein